MVNWYIYIVNGLVHIWCFSTVPKHSKHFIQLASFTHSRLFIQALFSMHFPSKCFLSKKHWHGAPTHLPQISFTTIVLTFLVFLFLLFWLIFHICPLMLPEDSTKGEPLLHVYLSFFLIVAGLGRYVRFYLFIYF